MMKKLLICGAMLMGSLVFAQENKPAFEKDGNLIKGTFYHENGEIKQEGTYKDGKLHGEWIMYDAEGKKVALAEYNQGEKTGKWFFWKEDRLIEVDYNSNKIADVTEWKNSNNIAISD